MWALRRTGGKNVCLTTRGKVRKVYEMNVDVCSSRMRLDKTRSRSSTPKRAAKESDEVAEAREREFGVREGQQ